MLACLCLVSSTLMPPAIAAFSEVPEDSIKIPPMVPEESVSLYLPSDSAPGKGLAVNIIYPKVARYKDGAPIVVVAPGGGGADGLGFEMHAAQVGFVEVRFAFPGGGKGRFMSSGIYDYRGHESQKAFRDVLLFAAGKLRDSENRLIYDLLPEKVCRDNIGIVGWSNGGNIALVTMYKYADQLQFINWIAFYESPLGSLFFPPNLGAERDLVTNKHYRQGSCATGDCMIDFHNLAYDPMVSRTPGEHKKRGEAEIPGVVYFDENHNAKWDESVEFAFSYASDVGLDKQIYPPEVTVALEHSQALVQKVHISPKKKPHLSEKTGLMAVIGPKDPLRKPVDPLAVQLRVPSQSATEATDKFAYVTSLDLNRAPISVRNRKYFFRPLPPDIAQQIYLEESGKLKKGDAGTSKRFINESAPAASSQGDQKNSPTLKPSDPDEQNSQKQAADGGDTSAPSAKIASAQTAGTPLMASADGPTADAGTSAEIEMPSRKAAPENQAKAATTDEASVLAPASDAAETTAPTADSATAKKTSREEKTQPSTGTKAAIDTPPDSETTSVVADTASSVAAKPATVRAPVKAPKLTAKQEITKIKFHTMHPIASVVPPTKTLKDNSIFKYMLCWPECIANLKESEAYYEERDGSLYIAQVIEKFPNLLVMVCGTEVDHLQRQADHPHIALQYNAWLSNKARWLRLNPDFYYMAAASNMNKGNFKNNPPRSPIDASEIALYLENEGVTPDYVLMEGAISELADRKRTKNLRGTIADVICPYTNPAFPIPPPPKKTAEVPPK